jgi:lipopolysaccharide export system permease protein
LDLPKWIGKHLIHKRAALRELTASASAVFVVLFSVLLTTQLIRLLGQAAGGKLLPQAVTGLLGFVALGYLPILFALTLFLAILLTFSRWYRDSEMAIWLSSGVALTDWVKVALRFGWPLLLLITVLSLWLAPWAFGRSEDYRQQLEQRDDAARVAPGAFNESAGGERVFFVEDVSSGDGRVKNVFVSAERNGELTVIATASGKVELAENGDRFLVLEGGRRYDMHPGALDYQMMEFARYGVRIETGDAIQPRNSLRSATTSELIAMNTPWAKGELLWRIGVPVSALLLALMAIPLAHVNPRGGRTNNLAIALLMYLLYSNLLSVSQAWVAMGKLDFSIGVWAIHALMALVVMLMFVHRAQPADWWRVWQR